MKLTKKMFVEELNQSGYKHSHANNKFGNRKSPYGDYLRRQDPEKFNVNFEEWKKAV